MRILVLTNMYPPHHYGGYELACADAVTRWRDLGHEVAVLTSTWRVPGVDDDPGEDPRQVRRELHLWWQDHEVPAPSLPARVRDEAANHRVLRATLAELEPDVVSAWAMGAMSLGLLGAVTRRGLPLVHVLCDDWLVYGPLLDAWSRLFRGWRAPLGRVVGAVGGLPGSLDGVGSGGPLCFASAACRERAERLSPLSLAADRPVVPLGIDAATFPVEAARPLPERGWTGRMLYVGRIDARKGIDVAVRALALLPGTTLEVLGRGDATHLGELRALAGRLGVADRVTFGEVPRAGLPERYRAADVVLFPVRWEEPFGLVPIEAMACDTPVVATATGGSAAFLRHEQTCLRVPVDDPEALAGAVERLRSDPGLRARLIRAGRVVAATLTAQRFADGLLAWHEAATHRFAQGRPRLEDPLAEAFDPGGRATA